MKRLLIIEPQLSGHHFRYLEWITSAACEIGWQVTIATDQRFREHATLTSLTTRHADRLAVYFQDFSGTQNSGGFFKLVQRETYYWKKLQITFQELNTQNTIDHVLLPFADICLYALAINPRPFGKCRWSAIAMRPVFHCHEMGLSAKKPGALTRIKELLFFRLANSPAIGKLCVIDPCLAEYVAKRRPQSRILYLQDPADINVPAVSREQARCTLGLDTTRPIVMLYGAVDWRKGVRELLEAQASLPLEQKPVVVVAGRQTQAVRTWLAGEEWQQPIRDGRLKILDRFITADEESLLFCACDAIWLGYRDHLGSSGVLWQALAFERPVIGCDEGLIGWLTRTKNLGVTVRVSDKQAVADALRTFPKTANLASGLSPLPGPDFAAHLLQAIG
ncbi:hypothetical protein E6Q11_05830 [Candidatus Dojkabacteria bacterium]|uniref:Glycosyltransferase n=1 Tax=Candidatus Dojkabacteria bacterium TaxID=2099670 RepID=A0A5C7J4X1_9BACT|nr:MAG: hypothetical protein E6Q11_05830 [Candidatus Dojkabacteria bacterium]